LFVLDRRDAIAKRTVRRHLQPTVIDL